MASIVFRKIKNEMDPDKQRRKGMVDAGDEIATQIDNEAGKVSPVFDADFADKVVLTTLAKYVPHQDYRVDYMGCQLRLTPRPDIFDYTDQSGTPNHVRIIPVTDDRVMKMTVVVPIPATPGLSVLEGYGAEVLDDLMALSGGSGAATAAAQKYFLATVMFRRCR